MIAESAQDMFFDPYESASISARNLPQWRQNSKYYYITYRLADSLPAVKLKQLEQEREEWKRCNSTRDRLTQLDIAEYYRLFHTRIETWLDQGQGACLLNRPEVAIIVADAMRFFDGKRYTLGEWVVMPNHVHVVLVVKPNEELSKILHSWKSFSAHLINKNLGRKGALWQEESYNHLVRNSAELYRINQYIFENPGKATVSVSQASWLK